MTTHYEFGSDNHSGVHPDIMKAIEFMTEDDNQYISIGFNDEQAARRAIQVLGENGITVKNLGFDARGVSSLRLRKSDEVEMQYALDNNHIQYSILSQIAETTTAGGIATVAGGMAPAFTRNASIYGNTKKKKMKKKSGKYLNSKDSD